MKIFSILAIACVLVFPAPSSAENLRVVSWNIANLHHETGVALRSDDPEDEGAREDVDYSRLSEIAQQLDADIYALQEIGSPNALERIFQSTDYHFIISDRYRPGDEARPASQRDIFNAFVVSRARFPEPPAITTQPAFSLQHIELSRDGRVASIRPTRAALELRLTVAGRDVVLLNVHLKSSCHAFPLYEVEDQNFFNGTPFDSRFDCRTLKAQLAILENWIELQQALGRSVIVAGDFNRRLNQFYRNPTRHEDFWFELNDGNPESLVLEKGPLGLDHVCWPNHSSRFEDHIDFFVLDAALVQAVDEYSINKVGLGYDDATEYQGDNRERLSDHCPVVLDITE